MVDYASAMTSRARAGFRADHVENQSIERNPPLFFDWSIYTFIFIKIDVLSC